MSWSFPWWNFWCLLATQIVTILFVMLQFFVFFPPQAILIELLLIRVSFCFCYKFYFVKMTAIDRGEMTSEDKTNKINRTISIVRNRYSFTSSIDWRFFLLDIYYIYLPLVFYRYLLYIFIPSLFYNFEHFIKLWRNHIYVAELGYEPFMFSVEISFSKFLFLLSVKAQSRVLSPRKWTQN